MLMPFRARWNLLLLEPGQGLAWLAPEQPVGLALAGIEDGHGHDDLPAGAASLLLLDGLSLLAGLVAVRWITHVTRRFIVVERCIKCVRQHSFQTADP
jgi:hypothetical protein